METFVPQKDMYVRLTESVYITFNELRWLRYSFPFVGLVFFKKGTIFAHRVSCWNKFILEQLDVFSILKKKFQHIIPHGINTNSVSIFVLKKKKKSDDKVLWNGTPYYHTVTGSECSDFVICWFKGFFFFF